jgi:tRNA threonylcarbamoyladenosine biosynthesis protein TsaB
MPSPPTLIAIDTATELCSVALLHAGELDERALAAGATHSQHVLPMLQQLLDAHRIRLRDCDAVAFGAGPGSFTGLRIACGVAQGLAYGLDLDVLPVSNLQAVAYVASGSAPRAPRRIGVAIDARMQEAYWAAYALEDGQMEEIAPAALIALSELNEAFAGFDVDTVAGNAFVTAPPPGDWQLVPDVRASAGAVAHLAIRRLEAGGAIAPHLAAPLYVRDRVALTIDERRVAQGRA